MSANSKFCNINQRDFHALGYRFLAPNYKGENTPLDQVTANTQSPALLFITYYRYCGCEISRKRIIE